MRQVYAQEDLKAASEAASEAAEDAAAALKKRQDDAYAALERAVSAQSKIYAASRDAAQELVASITSVFDLLKTNVIALYGQVDSTVGVQAAQGNAFIDQALSTAQKTGYLPDAQELADAIAGARGGVDSAIYASQADADFARLELAGRLDALKIVSGDQLSNAEKQLKYAQDQLEGLDAILSNAKDQLDAINGIDTSIRSVAEALALFNATLAGALAPAGSSDPTKTTKPEPNASQSTPGAPAGTGGTNASAVTPYSNGNYAQITNLMGLPNYQWVQDPVEVARLGSIEAYVNTTFDGTAQSLSDIASTAKEYGVSMQDVANAAGYYLSDIEKLFAGSGIQAFAGGGYHAGGLAIVGEQGPEIVNFAQPSQIYTAAQSQSMMGGSGRLEVLIEGLTAEVRQLQAIADKGSEASTRTANAIEGNQTRPLLVELVV